jgi:hypothetical protein
MVGLMLDKAIELTRVVAGCIVVEVTGVGVGADMSIGSGTITRRLATLSVGLDHLVVPLIVVWNENGMGWGRGHFHPLLFDDFGDMSIERICCVCPLRMTFRTLIVDGFFATAVGEAGTLVAVVETTSVVETTIVVDQVFTRSIGCIRSVYIVVVGTLAADGIDAGAVTEVGTSGVDKLPALAVGTCRASVAEVDWCVRGVD